MDQNQAEFMTVPHLVEYFNRGGQTVLSREFLYRQIKQGAIPHYRIANKIVVRLPEVLAALKQGAASKWTSMGSI